MASIKTWMKAFRLHTLPLALSASFLGSFLAASEGQFKWQVLLFGMLTTLFLQILSNLANDFGDAEKGTDNEHRVGPQRGMQLGLIDRRSMLYMILVFAFFSLLSGSFLLFFGLRGSGSGSFLLFYGLGLAAILAAIKYTVGKRPYGYAGFGDIMVFVFFGIVGVFGMYYLHLPEFNYDVILPASSLGLLSAAVLNLNNMRDRINDKASNKITLAIKLGDRGMKTYHSLLLSVAMLLAFTYAILNYRSPWQFLFVAVIPILGADLRVVYKSKDPKDLYPELKKVSLAALIFSLTFGVGQLI